MSRKRKRKQQGQQVRYPVPSYPYTYGEGSPLDLYRTGDIHCADAITWYVIERRANWNTGISHRLTTQDIADAAGIHPRTAQRSIEALIKKKLLKRRTPKRQPAHVYQLWPFDPEARQNRQTNAAPQQHGPLDQLAAGKIDRYAALLWMHLNIGWHLRQGETLPTPISLWEKITGMSRGKLLDCVAALKKAGLAIRTSLKAFASVFRLFPFKTSTKETYLEPLKESLAAAGAPAAAPEAVSLPGPEPPVLAAAQEASAPEHDPGQVIREANVFHYRGERYRHQSHGFERWMPNAKWVFVGERVPAAVLACV